MKAYPTNSDDDQRQARIEELKQKIRDATGENPVFGTMNGCPPEVEEAFLRNVLLKSRRTANHRTAATI